MVELALSLPLVCLLLLAVVQVGLVVRDQLTVQHAAREAARAASVSASPDQAARRSAAGRLPPEATVGVAAAAGTVTAVVTLVNPTDVPLVGMLLPSVTVRASVTMAREPP